MADEWNRNAERISALEVEIRHLQQGQDAMAKQLNEVHEVLLQAKGARWAIIGVAGLAGFLSGKMASIAAIFGFKVP